MEQFRDPQSNTLAIVDYAHNYASVTALLDFVYERWGEENPRITLVTGSAGNKAYDRRKEIVEAAENRIANFIFTAEDTDTEPIIDICMEMQGYITNKDVVSTVRATSVGSRTIASMCRSTATITSSNACLACDGIPANQILIGSRLAHIRSRAIRPNQKHDIRIQTKKDS